MKPVPYQQNAWVMTFTNDGCLEVCKRIVMAVSE